MSEPRGEQGVVAEVLPKGLFRVTLKDGRQLQVGITPSARHSMVRIISGDRVLVEVSPRDPTRGHITTKL
ncbi:MAG: translation initiation factor IF-1 [Polyangiaceae bacterium]|nr:translation initiation factor IF-1 [Polyangiaceae bacterium]MCW5792206.1 translation initiation factor IF-1 [Polyangiaceae bacterium]